MSLGDYLKGPEYKARAARLEAELQAQRQQSQAELQSLLAKYDDLQSNAREIGLLDLLAVKKQTLVEEERISSVKNQVAAAQADLDAARSQLQAVQQQILGAEDTICCRRPKINSLRSRLPIQI